MNANWWVGKYLWRKSNSKNRLFECSWSCVLKQMQVFEKSKRQMNYFLFLHIIYKLKNVAQTSVSNRSRDVPNIKDGSIYGNGWRPWAIVSNWCSRVAGSTTGMTLFGFSIVNRVRFFSWNVMHRFLINKNKVKRQNSILSSLVEKFSLMLTWLSVWVKIWVSIWG